LKAAAKLIVGSMYENREADILPSRPGLDFIVPNSVGINALLDQHRIIYPF